MMGRPARAVAREWRRPRRVAKLSAAEDRLRMWMRVVLGGERMSALARELGYADASGVFRLIARLEMRGRRKTKPWHESWPGCGSPWKKPRQSNDFSQSRDSTRECAHILHQNVTVRSSPSLTPVEHRKHGSGFFRILHNPIELPDELD